VLIICLVQFQVTGLIADVVFFIASHGVDYLTSDSIQVAGFASFVKLKVTI
jgi:hypothetical protein